MNDLDKQRKRLRFRAWHRGTKESDLIMGGFADRYLPELGHDELLEFERILDIPDAEIMDWVMDLSPVPDDVKSPLVERLVAFRPGS